MRNLLLFGRYSRNLLTKINKRHDFNVNIKKYLTVFVKQNDYCLLASSKRVWLLKNDLHSTVTNWNNLDNVNEEIKSLLELRDNPRLNAEARFELLKELWKDMENNLVIREQHFLLKLDCYQKCRKNIDPKLFLKEVDNAGLQKSEILLKKLLGVVAEHGDPGYVATVISSMKGRNYVVDETVFSCLITAYGVKKDSNNIRFVVNSMKESGMKQGQLTFTSLMRAAAITGDYAALHTARTQAEQNKIKFSDENISSILETLVRFGNNDLIPSLSPLVKSCSPDHLNQFITNLIYNGFASGAYSILKSTKNEEISSKCKEYVQEIIQANTSLNQQIDIAKSMINDKTYNRAFYDILYSKMLTGKINESLVILEACCQTNQIVRPHFFWPLLVSNHQEKGEDGIFEILKFMKENKIKPDKETFTNFVLPRLTIDDDDAVLKRLRDESGITISNLIEPFLSHLIKTGHLLQAIKLYEKFEKSAPKNKLVLMESLSSGYLINRDYKSTVQLIKLFKIDYVGNWLVLLFSLRKWLPIGEYSLLFKELAENGCWINAQCEKLLLQIFNKNGNISVDVRASLKNLVNENATRSDSVFIPHPDNMNAEELKNHVTELEQKGGNPRGALRKLIQQSCRSGDVESAQKAYEKLIEMDAELSPGILSSMLQAYVLSGRLTDALQIYQKLNNEFPRFQIDSFKILDFACLLVKSQKYDDAVLMINKNPQSRKNTDGIERNCWELLKATADMENVERVKQMMNLLMVNNFCKATNVILGPLIKKLLKNDVNAAVDEFCNFARLFKKTPAQLDVMLAAVLSNNENLVIQVKDAISGVHGLQNASSVLVTAYAQSGNVERIKAELKTSKMNFEDNLLQNQINRMSELGQIESLNFLLTAGIDESIPGTDFLINRILHTYQKSGDTDCALKFWTNLQEKGYQLSEQQKSSLSAIVASTSKYIFSLGQMR